MLKERSDLVARGALDAFDRARGRLRDAAILVAGERLQRRHGRRVAERTEHRRHVGRGSPDSDPADAAPAPARHDGPSSSR